MEASSYFVWDYVFASVLMAIGIGMDVAIVTVSRASSLQCRRLALVWVIGVSLTHTILPMVGYLFTYFSIKLHPLLTPTIGLLASGLILFYLVSELRAYSSSSNEEYTENEATSKENSATYSTNSTGAMSPFSKQLLGTLGLIIAVSWDALWSGPAKSAQVTDWPEFWVWASFAIVGLVITVMSVLALKLGQKMSQKYKLNQGMTRFVAALIQFGVIGYFGLLALTTYTFGLMIPWWLLLQLSFTLVMVALLIVGNQSVASRAVT